MNKSKEILVTGFALFAMFFGAGNLILPPNLGFQAGVDWWIVCLGFAISAVVIPLLGILAHARLQGTILDFGNKVSYIFSLIYSSIIYLICVLLPGPRTASVTHEMAIEPFFNTGSLLTSSIYFTLVLLFSLNRSAVIDLMGKYLTPLIILLLFVITGIAIFSVYPPMKDPVIEAPLIYGLLEGYQTFDAIAAIVVGGVIIVSIKLRGKGTFLERKNIVSKAGFIAGTGLLLIYAGLIFSGALLNSVFDSGISRTGLLASMSLLTLGTVGRAFLSVLITLACFTTAVGITTGTSDFVKGVFKGSQKAYVITAFITASLGVLMGQLEVGYIIEIAIPVLLVIYPLTIVLILLNVLHEKYASVLVFRSVVTVTILFSIPDLLLTAEVESVAGLTQLIPFGEYNLGWVLPALVTFFIANYIHAFIKSKIIGSKEID